jgi:hypothetical protein
MLRQCEQYLLIRPFRSLALRDFVGGVARQGQCLVDLSVALLCVTLLVE